eukprot:TRINITY_DN1661_c0_g3_i2.p1 TRINITY_DN1661_c0_g3~~TRINITY_DN1661_c0_g3_i2.p1  ORF type:complete len:625 (-),score=159.27 TRINITY_DN1661_c0_g3_i2:71-1945(-)
MQSNYIELDHAIGYTGEVANSLLLHPGQQDYISISGANIIIGDLSDPHKQRFLKGHDDQVSSIAISHSGKLLASGQVGDNSDVFVWDFEQGKLLYKLSEHDFAIATLDFSHDDRLLISCGSQIDGKLFIWDMITGCIVSTMAVVPGIYTTGVTCARFGGFVKDIKLRATSKYQFAVAGGKRLAVWSLDPFSGEMKHEVMNTSPLVREYTCLAFSPNNEAYLYAGTTTGDFCAFQIKNKILVFAQPVCSNGITTIATLPGERVCVGGGDGLIALFQISEATCQQLCKVSFLGAINGLSASPDGVQILAATNRGFIYRIRAADFSKMLMRETHTRGVVHVTYSVGNSDSEHFMTSSRDGSLRLWDANDYSATTRCAILTAGHPSLSVFTDEIILSGWTDGKIRCFRTDNGDPLWNIDNAHKDGVTGLEWSHNKKFMVSGGTGGEVRVWEMKTKDLVTHLKEHTGIVTGLYIFSDDTHALSCARDRRILCWDLKSEKRVIAHTQRMGGVNSVAVFGDEKGYLSTGQEKKIVLWDLRQSTPVSIVDAFPSPGPEDELQSIALSKDNKYFVTSGNLGVVRLWDTSTLKMMAEVKAHSGCATCARFSPDEKQIVSTGEDGLIMIWNLFTS